MKAILYNAARAVVHPQKISNQICSGGVGAAVLSKNGNIYTGVCIDTDCSLGMCAERNAISSMITKGEFEIKMVVAVDKKGNVLPPCGACREFMMQLKNSKDTEVLVDNNGMLVKLADLMPYSYS
ncbi:MAG: cytidine deaminase [Eubacterium sp.]|mgnify:CR=1 FL=1